MILKTKLILFKQSSLKIYDCNVINWYPPPLVDQVYCVIGEQSHGKDEIERKSQFNKERLVKENPKIMETDLEKF